LIAGGFIMGKGWKNPTKVANAQKKGAVFTKLAREIQVAAKMGGPDPAMNARLRLAIDNAKKQQCPNDTIDRALKKGAGLLDDGTIIEELMYEGYGPHSVGVLVECQTDNRNRTAPEIRTIFKTNEGNMDGSVAWMFDRVCLLEGTKPGEFDPEEEAIEAGADEVSKHDEGYSFYGDLTHMEDIRKALAARGWTITTAEPSYKPKNITELNDAQLKDVHDFLNELDEHDDTHRVHVTIKS
jgi:YebC/PmpR family DNA-binding regulatory protein